MQRSIGEDRILRLGDTELVPIRELETQVRVIGAGLGDHLRRRVDAIS
jgi:hypothetical protein